MLRHRGLDKAEQEEQSLDLIAVLEAVVHEHSWVERASSLQHQLQLVVVRIDICQIFEQVPQILLSDGLRPAKHLLKQLVPLYDFAAAGTGLIQTSPQQFLAHVSDWLKKLDHRILRAKNVQRNASLLVEREEAARLDVVETLRLHGLAQFCRILLSRGERTEGGIFRAHLVVGEVALRAVHLLQ